MNIHVGVERSKYGHAADKIFLTMEGRNKPYELSKKEAYALAVSLVENSLELKKNELKRSVVVYNQNECGVMKLKFASPWFASPWHNPERIDRIRIKVKNQPRIQINREVAGFLANELREFSDVPLYTPKEAEEYLRNKLLEDV